MAATVPGNAPGVSSQYLHSFQRLQVEEKLAYSLIDWLLPNLRMKGLKQSPRWDDFWRLFGKEGQMDWHTFEKFLRWDCKLNAARIFQVLDDSGSGFISKHGILRIRRSYERVIDCRHSGLDDLKMVLMRKYGNIMIAWRLLFDPESLGRCSHAWFVKSCKEVGFHGDLKLAWSELTRGEIHRPASVKDLDPDADQVMMDFAVALKDFHGSPSDGWTAIMRSHGIQGRMSLEAFERVCSSMDFDAKLAKKVFSYLDTDCSKSITLDEWSFGSLWEKRIEVDSPQAGSPGGPTGKGRQSGKSAWQEAAGGGNDGGNIEFRVVLTHEEYKEYLRRRRDLEMGATSRPPPAISSPSSAAASRSSQTLSGRPPRGGGAGAAGYGGYPAPPDPWATLA